MLPLSPADSSPFHSHAPLRVSSEKFARDEKFIQMIGRPLTTDGPAPAGTLGLWESTRRSRSEIRLPRVETPATLTAAHSTELMSRSRRAVRDGLNAELSAKRRVIRLRRDLARSKSQAALDELHDRNRAAAKAAKAEAEALRMAHRKGLARHVKPASPAEVTALARQMVEHMEKTEVDASNRGWYVLFKRMDDNGDGLITCVELLECIRDSMGFDEEELPEGKLQAVWNAIDRDGNGWIDAGEFGRFFRAGEAAYAPVVAERRRKKMLQESRALNEEAERLANQAGDVEAQRAHANAARLEYEAQHLEQSLSEPRLAKSRGAESSRGGQLSRGGQPTRSSMSASSATALPPLH